MKRVYPTHDGRKLFTTMLYSAVMTGRVFGITRYGRLMGGVVSADAMEIIAGLGVKEEVRKRVQQEAASMLDEWNASPKNNPTDPALDLIGRKPNADRA